MQFLPAPGADGDDADPQDIDEATVAAGRYCARDRDRSTIRNTSAGGVALQHSGRTSTGARARRGTRSTPTRFCYPIRHADEPEPPIVAVVPTPSPAQTPSQRRLRPRRPTAVTPEPTVTPTTPTRHPRRRPAYAVRDTDATDGNSNADSDGDAAPTATATATPSPTDTSTQASATRPQRRLHDMIGVAPCGDDCPDPAALAGFYSGSSLPIT